jgi:predicted porin
VHSNFIASKNVSYHSNTPEKSDTDTSLPRLAAGEANIKCQVKGALENGTRYGATFDIYAMKGDTGVDKMFLTGENDNVGVIQVGNLKGPDCVMPCGGQQLMGGTTGVDGTVAYDMDYSTGVVSPVFMVGNSSKATKIVYYSPVICGFQLGLGITPDTKQIGHNKKNRHTGDSSHGNDEGLFKKSTNDKERPSGRNNLAFGLSHSHNFENGFKTKFAVVSLLEDTKQVKTKGAASSSVESTIHLKNARAIHLTGQVSYNDWSFGAGYINNGKSRLPVQNTDFTNVGGFIATKNSNAGHVWNVGARYKYKDWTFSAVFHRTQRKIDVGEKTRGNMLTSAVDYKICDGLLVFTEIDYIFTRSCDKACKIRDAHVANSAIKKQRCLLIVLGAKVSF